jgi:hypothetical protein
MIRKNTLIGAAGAGALVAVALVGPASAAGELSATVNYSCATGAAKPVAVFTVDAPASSTMVAGQTVSLPTTATFSLTAAETALAKTVLGGALTTQFSGTITTATSNTAVGQAITLPKTLLGNDTGGATLVNNATGTTKLRYTAAGTFTLAVGNAGKVQLQGYKADDTPTGVFTFPSSNGAFGPCLNPTGPTHLQAAGVDQTVTVSKDASATTLKATYAKATKKATGVAHVKGKTFGLTGTGKVKFTLKRGTTKVATKTVALKKGAAKAVFAKVSKRGKYSITASYGGSAGLGKSSKRATFKVS